MAFALIPVVLEHLASYVQNETRLAANILEQVINLTGNLKLVQDVLVDAVQKQVMKNHDVMIWTQLLTKLVYDADDLLDEWHTKTQIQTQTHVAVGSCNKVLSCFCSRNVMLSYDISRKIIDINKRLDVITKQITDFGLQVVYQNHDETTRVSTNPVVDVSKIIYGRDAAKEDVISRLLGENSSEPTALRVVSIIGRGGIGKTTLAQLIFNEVIVQRHFETRMWVCVSDPCNTVRVAKEIVKEAKGDVPESAEWEEVYECLCQSLKGKRFFLVLDDVWSEDPSHWRRLKLALNNGAPGSRILVTTRNKEVARVLGSTDSDIHYLKLLSDEESWLIMRQVAFSEEGYKLDYSSFVIIGKEIVQKCSGAPLVILTIASLLCERQTIEEWMNVLTSDIWDTPDNDNVILPSLFLSYYWLPHISKQCFLFCAIFPKDFQIQKDYLIKLWMAQGFFGFGERRELERIGEIHFYILAKRSLFQDFVTDSDGNILCCKMHDLVHDLAMHLSQKECSYLEAGDTIRDSDDIRHLCASDPDYLSILKVRNLRTLVLLTRVKTAVLVELFGKLTRLRALDLSYCLLAALPKEVEKLVHLRHLDLSCMEFFHLPETICNLYNLQFLGLKKCKNLHTLPEKIGKLINLVYLQIEETDALSYFPETIAALSSLRSLCKFIVSGVDHGCKIGDLQFLNDLQGALELKGLSRVKDEKDAIQAELHKKRYLRELAFNFMEESNVLMEMKNTLEKLKPHDDLEILEICDYPDSQFPSWVQSCSVLTKLVEIRLYRCKQCTELPSFGKLAFLKKLVIKGASSVTSIGDEFYGFGADNSFGGQMLAFQKLDYLVIQDMEKLEEWEIATSNDRKMMPFLTQLHLGNCSKLKALPHVWQLESLEVLKFWELPSVVRVGLEFLDDNECSVQDGVVFPKLCELYISDMDGLEEWSFPLITPCLEKLHLSQLPELKTLPTFVYTKTPASVWIER